MKQAIAFLVSVSIWGMSCNKPLPDYSGVPFDYVDTGIRDVIVAANDYVRISSYVKLLSGNAAMQPVSVSFTGMPPNVYLAYDSLTFRTNYYLSDSLGARNAVPGVYPMQAIFSNAAAGTKTYNFNLNIIAPINRAAQLIGYYYPSNSCGPYEYISCTIDTVSGAPGKIIFIDRISTDNINSIYDTSYGIVDCCTNTFVIPTQIVPGGTLSGSGSFNGNTHVVINKSLVTDSATYPCIVTLGQN